MIKACLCTSLIIWMAVLVHNLVVRRCLPSCQEMSSYSSGTVCVCVFAWCVLCLCGVVDPICQEVIMQSAFRTLAIDMHLINDISKMRHIWMAIFQYSIPREVNCPVSGSAASRSFWFSRSRSTFHWTLYHSIGKVVMDLPFMSAN